MVWMGWGSAIARVPARCAAETARKARDAGGSSAPRRAVADSSDMALSRAGWLISGYEAETTTARASRVTATNGVRG